MQDEEQSSIRYGNRQFREILADSDLPDGDHELIRNVPAFEYPIKIVVSVEGNVITVITNYPLKKGIDE